MDCAELSDIAWDLVDHCRPDLTIAELNTVFVRLGVGDYSDAVTIALKSLARTTARPLPQPLIVRLTRWAELHYSGQQLDDLRAVFSPAADHAPTPAS